MQHDDVGHVEVAHELEDLVLVADVEVVGGLVEQEVAGLLREGAGDQHALLLAAGQRRRRRVCESRAPTRRSAAADAR